MNRDNAFGQQVRQRRRALDLTQDELARRVGCAAITLRKIEAGDARPSQQIAERLALALAIPLDERAEFVRQARAALVPGDRAPEGSFTPQVTSEEIGADDLSGRAIRSYLLHDKIGAGAFGVVYRATQPLVEREVAIKIILPQYANHPDFIRRFEAEAQLVARLEHPHIVPLYDYWREPGVAYLVMRLLRGGNVNELLQHGLLPLDTITRLMEQVGSALHTAHRAGVVHRDLKPSNVLLDEDGNAYLADFGIAKNLSDPATQTQAGIVIGSPAYMSPEQINADPIRPQADIYSLGVMLYELLTGSRPFLGPTPIDLIQQHLYTPLPPLAANRSGLPEAFDQLIARATAKDPNDRYADVDQLLVDFHEVLQTGHMPAVLQAPVTPPFGEIVNPYKGLRAFEEADTPDFFGREALTQQLLTRLGEGGDLNRFLAVIGPSGSGKSSVVKAGLLPALRRGGLVGSENWFVVEMTPGPHPLEELEAALLRIAVNPLESLLAQLREDRRGLLHAINRTLPANNDTELVLIIDQFEEVFTLVDDEAERVQLLDDLVAAIMAEQSRVRVIITLRADFVDRPLRYVDFGELVQRRSELVLPLTPDELERAIVGPADRVGLHLESGLPEAISADVIEQPGALPLLQYALTELYEMRSDHTLTKATYQTIGGVRGALGRRAEEVFTTLDPAGQLAAQQMFLRLVTLGEGTEDVRRRVQRVEVESLTPAPLSQSGRALKGASARDGGEGEMSSVVDAFGKARLLTFDRDLQTRGPTLEVAHEALLREWPRLSEWLDENRSDVRLQRQLAAEAVGWLEADRDASFLLRGSRLQQFEDWAQTTPIGLTADERSYLRASLAERQRQQVEEKARQAHEMKLERRSQRILQVLVGLAFVAAIISGGLAISASLQRNRAEEAEARAVNEAQVRATQQAVAEASFTRAEAQRLGAEAYRLLKTDGSAELIALLSLQSLKMQYSPQGDAALTGALTLALPKKLFAGHTQGVTAVAFSPDGQSILTGGKDNAVRLWDARTGQALKTLTGHTSFLISVVFSPDGKRALTSADDGTARLWDLEMGETLATIEGKGGIRDVTFSPDGQEAWIADGDNTVQLWDVSATRPISTFPLAGYSTTINFLKLAPDGRYILFSGEDNIVRLLDLATGAEVHAFAGHTGQVRGMAFSTDGQYLLTGSMDGTARLWDIQNGQVLHSIAAPGPITGVTLTPDNRYALTSGFDNVVRLWDIDASKEVRQFRAGGNVNGWYTAPIAFSPDGKAVLTGSNDNLARLWEVEPVSELPQFIGHSGPVLCIVFSPDGQFVLTSSMDKTARLWDARTGQSLRQFLGHTQLVLNAAYAPDGQSVLTGSDDETAQQWNPATGEVTHKYRSEPFGPIWSVAFSRDGQFVLTAGGSGHVWMFATSTGLQMQDYQAQSAVQRALFSPDGKSIAVVSGYQAVLWDLAGSQKQTFLGHTDWVNNATFSSDGRYLVTASEDKTARLWDVQTGRELHRFSHADGIVDVAFAPDGKTIATASRDNTARLWDAQTGQELRRLPHSTLVDSVAFSPDGKYVLTGSDNGIARLWDIDYHTTMQYLCSRLQRDLTDDERAQYGITDTTPTCPK